MEEVRVRLRASWAERCAEGLLAEFQVEDEEEQPRRAARRTYAGGESYQPRSTQSGRLAASSVAERSVEKGGAGAERAVIGVGPRYQAEVEPLLEEEEGCACTRRWCECRPELVTEPLVLDDEREGELVESGRAEPDEDAEVALVRARMRVAAARRGLEACILEAEAVGLNVE